MSITAAAAPGHHSRHWLSCFAIPIFGRTEKIWPKQGEKEDFTTNDDLYGRKIMDQHHVKMLSFLLLFIDTRLHLIQLTI
jgi:hypothetical protein